MSSDKVDSVLRMRSKTDLETFAWERLLDEASLNAPVLFSILSAAAKTKTKRSNTQVVIGTCLAILLKHRSKRMNLVQKIMSLILHNGGASKQVQLLILHKLQLFIFLPIIFIRFILDCKN